jgi:hypothetical protein
MMNLLKRIILKAAKSFAGVNFYYYIYKQIFFVSTM